MSITCPGCRTSLPIQPEKSAGKSLRCPKCRTTFAVSASSATRVPPSRVPAEAPSAPKRAKSAPQASEGAAWKKFLIAGILAGLLLPLFGIGGVLLWQKRAARANRLDVARNPSPSESIDLEGVEKPTPSGDGSLNGTKPFGEDRTAPDLAVIDVAGKPVQFMGLSATGNRVCIIADVSGSMRSFNRIDRLRKEVKKTLTELAPDQEFHVIFFHNTADQQPGRGWVRGKDAGQVLPWVEGQNTRGGTQPLPAFRVALQLNPRPDVIFFMTDGMIPTNVAPEVAKLNTKAAKKVPIHTILFGGEEPGADGKVNEKVLEKMKLARKRAEATLEPISKESGGTHRFVPDDPKAITPPKAKAKK